MLLSRCSQMVKKGDLFELGRHRLLCGDALSLSDMKRLMNGKQATMMFTDIPYAVNYKREGHSWKHNYKTKLEDFDDSFFDLAKFLKLLEQGFVKGACYICCGTGQIGQIYDWCVGYLKQRPTMIIWLKSNQSIQRGHYDRRYEQLMYFWFPENKWRGEKNKANSDVWYIQNRDVSKYMHPTQKPLRLIQKAILNSSDEYDIVLDPFGGSGSTLIAAEKNNRACYMMEIMPSYVEKIIKRWEQVTGKKAKQI